MFYIRKVTDTALSDWFVLILWRGSGLLNNRTKYCEFHGFGTVAVGDFLIDCPWACAAAYPIHHRASSESKRTSSHLIRCSVWILREIFATQLLVLQVTICLSAVDGLSTTSTSANWLLIVAAGHTTTQTCCLLPLNQIDSEDCCSLWLCVSSADVWKCLTGMAGTHPATEPGEKGTAKPWDSKDGSRGYSQKECDAFHWCPFHTGDLCSTHI